MKNKYIKKIDNIKNVLLIFFVTIILIGLSYNTYYYYNMYKNNKENEGILEGIKVNKKDITENVTERMLQINELKKNNSDIIGWIEIEGTRINYPVLQTTDNDFYVNHNYKKEESTLGSIFLDKDFDLKNGSSNYLIYGHRVKNGSMFEDLIKYQDEGFYKEHKRIKFTTEKEDCEYEVVAAFKSRVYYKSEKNVFRYYYFVNAEDEEEYDEFIKNAKKVSIYDTGVNAKYGEQLLTLSSCAYHTEDGRFAVVFKKVE